jgi:hypothetical protein
MAIDICSREIGRSRRLFKRLNVANWKTMCKLERNFEVMRVIEHVQENIGIMLLSTALGSFHSHDWYNETKMVLFASCQSSEYTGIRNQNQRSPVSVKGSQCKWHF